MAKAPTARTAEHPHRLCTIFDHEVDPGALGAADPVALHGQHPLRPAIDKIIHVVQQPLGVLGDLEVPLGQQSLGHHRAATLAQPGDHLLVRQDRLVLRAPVDIARLAVGQSALPESQEQPLGPAVILRIGGVQPAGPVEAQPVAPEGAWPGSRCSRTSTRPGARSARSQHSRRLVRRSPSRWGGVRRSPSASSNARRHRPSRTPRRGPCAGRRTDRETCPARTGARQSRHRRAQKCCRPPRTPAIAAGRRGRRSRSAPGSAVSAGSVASTRSICSVMMSSRLLGYAVACLLTWT